jgi:hypothetical protein
MEDVALAFLLVIAFVVGIVAGTIGSDNFDKGRCHERWKYQHTYQDTLATLRTGCEFPRAIKN